MNHSDAVGQQEYLAAAASTVAAIDCYVGCESRLSIAASDAAHRRHFAIRPPRASLGPARIFTWRSQTTFLWRRKRPTSIGIGAWTREGGLVTSGSRWRQRWRRRRRRRSRGQLWCWGRRHEGQWQLGKRITFQISTVGFEQKLRELSSTEACRHGDGKSDSPNDLCHHLELSLYSISCCVLGCQAKSISSGQITRIQTSGRVQLC